MKENDLVVSLREYVEALFEEKDRALQMAADEREKAAEVLRQEQHRAVTTAEAEREKAASALRDSLAQSIREGDERLREHIGNQIMQVTASLKSGELLELERIKRCEALVSGVHDELIALIDANTREFKQIQSAAMQAIEKAEQAQHRVNVGQNEFRASLSDQAATLMPRRESEAKHEAHVLAIRELRDDIGRLRTELAVGPSGLGTLEGRVTRSEGRHEGSSAILASILGLAVLAVAAAGVIVAVVTN